MLVRTSGMSRTPPVTATRGRRDGTSALGTPGQASDVSAGGDGRLAKGVSSTVLAVGVLAQYSNDHLSSRLEKYFAVQRTVAIVWS
jgi:hypothetical protein